MALRANFLSLDNSNFVSHRIELELHDDTFWLTKARLFSCLYFQQEIKQKGSAVPILLKLYRIVTLKHING